MEDKENEQMGKKISEKKSELNKKELGVFLKSSPIIIVGIIGACFLLCSSIMEPKDVIAVTTRMGLVLVTLMGLYSILGNMLINQFKNALYAGCIHGLFFFSIYFGSKYFQPLVGF